MNTKKISIDFSEESFDLLEEIKKEYNLSTEKKLSNSFIVNTLFINVFSCPIKSEIVNMLKSLRDHFNLMALNTEEQFFREDINSKIDNLSGLILLFEKFEVNKDVTIEENLRKVKMMGDRNIIFPSDWYVLNESKAENSTNACVVVCRHLNQYDIPIFLYFHNEKNVGTNEYNDSFKSLLYKAIINVYPDFQIILEQQINSICENGKIMNSNQCIQAPTVGIFKIIDSETLKKVRESDGSYNPPYGAFIQLSS